MKNIFVFLFFFLTIKVFADPSIKFRELMGWFPKNEKEIISAGGKLFSEVDLSVIKKGVMKIYKLEKEDGTYILTVVDKIVSRIEFSNMYLSGDEGKNIGHPARGIIRYKTENELKNDAKQIEYLVQSLNGRLTETKTALGITSQQYNISLDNTFSIDIFVYSFDKDKAINHYGWYEIWISTAR